MSAIAALLRRPRAFLQVALIFCILLIATLFQTGKPLTLRDAREGSSRSPSSHCPTAPQDKIAIILKTGTSEGYDKLPAQLDTTMSCVQNLLIISDLDMDFAGHHLHDALADVNRTIRDTDPTFDIYHDQRRLKAEGWTLQQLSNGPDFSSPSREAAWHLDKYKFIHGLDVAQRELPGMDWYFFMETDTYLVLPNLLAWLQRLDHRQELFIGSPVSLTKNGVRHGFFNHGGPGYVLSGALLRLITSEHPNLASDWDTRMGNIVFGDSALSQALNEFAIPIFGVWPMLSQQRPLQLPFTDSLWCQSVVSMHRLSPADIREMWRFERAFDFTQRPMLFQDIYDYWIPNGMPRYRSSWENSVPEDLCELARDHEPQKAAASLDACRKLCDQSSACLQFLYRDQMECTLYSCFTFGEPRTEPAEPQWESGWQVERIKAWISRARASCTTPEWVAHSTANAQKIMRSMAET